MPEKADPVSALREALAFIADWAHECSPSNGPEDSRPDPALYGFDAIEERARAALSGEAPDRDGEAPHRPVDQPVKSRHQHRPHEPICEDCGHAWRAPCHDWISGEYAAPSLEGARHPEAGETSGSAAASGPVDAAFAPSDGGVVFEDGPTRGADRGAAEVVQPTSVPASGTDAGDTETAEPGDPTPTAAGDGIGTPSSQVTAALRAPSHGDSVTDTSSSRYAASPGARHDVPDLDELDAAWKAVTDAVIGRGWDWAVTIEHQESGNNVTEPHEEWFTVRLALGTAYPEHAQHHSTSHPELALALRELAARLSPEPADRPPVLVPRDEPTREDIEG